MKMAAAVLLLTGSLSASGAGEPSVIYLRCDFPTVVNAHTGRLAKFVARSYRVSIDDSGRTTIENPGGACARLSGLATAASIEGSCDSDGVGTKIGPFRQVLVINRLTGSITDRRIGDRSFTLVGSCEASAPQF